ncbi:MAG: InlB B-repeat-containing protein [Lachnospiraceae bacterium]|nr:InlB B-repeat-containing protein [Lachnospiraceae bacterium]
MYRRLKNILGVSLMVLAIVISQIPMPETQAETVKEMTEADMRVDDTSAHVVTFSMNGGTYRGSYNSYQFQDKTPVLVIDDGKAISSFPDDRYASCSGYKTEANTWYTDQECLTKYDMDSPVTESITLYKKWYNITSDGTTLAAKGFHISADGTVLYRYDGEEALVEIPQTVTTIASGAFDDLSRDVRGITLPGGIEKIDENAFRGVGGTSITYIYDSGTAASKNYGRQLAEKYEQLVYSEYLDPEKTEEIAGISLLSDNPAEEESATPEGSSRPAESGAGDAENETDPKGDTTKPAGDDNKPSDGSDGTTDGDNKQTGDGNPDSEKDNITGSSDDTSDSDSSGETPPDDNEKPTESEEEESTSSSEIVIEPDEKYTVIFDTGISDVEGEQRKVSKGETISELVSVNGDQPRILRKDTYQIEQDDGKQEITYIFKGWYKDNACTTEWDFSEDVIEKNTTIYAKWDKQTRAYFHVTYSTTQGNEGAANIPGRQKLYADQKLEKPAGSPSIANKTFKGWYTSAAGGSEYTSWGRALTQDMTLYAHFEGKSNTVVFQMNGGRFTGNYNGTSYTDAASLTAKITAGKAISSSEYPGSGSTTAFKYSNYTTDANWYKDKECLEVYQNGTVLSGDITLYKKWYSTSSGFTMDPSGKVLYRYSGSVEDVTIPDTVTVIGSDAFASVGGISNIILPDNISEVKENAFSGVNKVSKDITITGKTEKAQNMAKELANQYTRLVYKESELSEDDGSVVISKAASGSIKLGATLSGSMGTTGTTTAAAASDKTSTTGTIALGASGVGAATTAGTQTTTVSQPTSGSQSAAVSQNTVTSAQQAASDSSASVTQGARTTQKQNTTSASAPKSTQHIKDSTPKTGDPLQYRMLIVCAMFSVGVLLVLTGNGKRKRFSAS